MAELKVGKLCIHAVKDLQLNFDERKVSRRTERREVYLLAIAGIWAMVRRPGCMPYVAEVKSLEPKPA